MARLGVLGGTFNPPHLGHLALASHARRELDLDSVLLIPANRSPHKPTEEDPGAQHRLQMCRLLVHGDEGLRTSELELERGGPSYTVDTLRALHAEYPETRLTLIVGADVARTVPSWHEPRALLELADLAVALRGDAGTGQVREALTGSLPRGGPVRFLKMPAIEVSSSLVRQRVREGLPVRELVGGEVAAYIAAHSLYRRAAPTPVLE